MLPRVTPRAPSSVVDSPGHPSEEVFVAQGTFGGMPAHEGSGRLSAAPYSLTPRTIRRGVVMSGELKELLKHRHIYVPRGNEKDTLQRGKSLGLAVAREHRAHLTVVAPRKNSATHHPELAKLDIVTERSGYPQDGGVVLAWCPTFKVMEKVQQLEQSVVVLVEWIPREFDAWAKLHAAFNVGTGEVMDAGLSPEASKALEGIVYEGYNGWTGRTDELMTLGCLKDLAASRTYDRELVLAYARQSKSEQSIERLKKILNKFETSQKPLQTPPDSDARTWRER